MVGRKKKRIVNKRIIAVAVIVGLSTMGAGYASWNDGVVFENNISSGELDIELNSDIDCRWYMITIGGVTGVAKVQIEMQPENNLINIDITKFLVSFIPKDLRCGLWIEIPFSVRNDGTMTVENTILYDNNSDKYIDILDDSEIGVREERQSLLRINLLEVDDGRVETRYKIAGVDRGGWDESISIVLKKRSIFNPFNKICESNVGIEKSSFNSYETKDEGVQAMSFSEKRYLIDRTTGSSIEYYGAIEKIEYDGETSIEEIDENKAQEIIDNIMNPPIFENEVEKTTGVAIKMGVNKTTDSSIGAKIEEINEIFKKYEEESNTSK